MTDNTTGAEPERRLIAIDAETVEEARLLELEARTYANYLEHHHQMPGPAASTRRKAAALRSILAAWEEGITSDESVALRTALAAPEVLSDYGKEQVDGAREKLTKFAPLIKPRSDPAPQEAE